MTEKEKKPELITSNGLTEAEAERLHILSEECGEVIQAIGKILRHGYDKVYPPNGPTNRSGLEKELGHVEFMAHWMAENGDIDPKAVEQSKRKKNLTIGPYLHHQGPFYEED